MLESREGENTQAVEMASKGIGFEKHLKSRYWCLTLLLFGLLMFGPFIPGFATNLVFLSVIVISARLVTENSRAGHVVTILGLVTMASMTCLTILGSSAVHVLVQPVGILLTASVLAFLIYCGALILLSLLRIREVTANEIFAAVNLYLILGFIWAYAYILMHVHDPSSFRMVSAGHGESLDLVFFSFVTLTTLGYGDITPATSATQMLAVIEAILGNLYVGVVVTYLLSIHISQKLDRSDGGGGT